ncbi:hypothetical protein F4803DRAFT_249140 [Xylaria telfairii]|nr:hypothetical protein F4803DRAFT_249140 [Xylaria telfairii]
MSPLNNSKLDLLSSVFNHLVLPPKIPGAQDTNINAVSRDILTRMIHATDTAINITSYGPWRGTYQNLQDSLRACLELNRGHLEKGCLLKHLQELDLGKVLILYLNEQNAGLLIRRDKTEDGEFVVFESFEASAISCKVLAAGHAMRWDFPGRSARIRLDDFSEDSFQECLSTFLEQASLESLYYLQASARKAGVTVGEIRDTTDPALITQMLMSLLEAVGSHYQAPVLRKRIRDDVNLTGTDLPWRRLPFWLILRVAAQRHLCFALGAEQGQVGYKLLMAILLAELLNESAQNLSPHKVVCLRTKLARRMAKLGMNPEKAKFCEDAACESWLLASTTFVRNAIENANERVETAWNNFKKTTTRHVPDLPDRAPNSSLKLTLSNSGRCLDEILSTRSVQLLALGPLTLPNPLDKSIQRSQQLTGCAFNVAALEQRIERDARHQFPHEGQNHEDRCIALARQIQNVFDTVGTKYKDQIKEVFKAQGSVYESSPEQNSTMILAIFTLWVDLDKSAIAACQLLAEHAPVFHPELLDVLQLPTKLAMERLQCIQDHLASRHARSNYGNMLETHSHDSFAVRYAARSEYLKYLEHEIETKCYRAREQKMEQYTRLCNKYDECTEGISANQCLCKFEDGEWIQDEDCIRCLHKTRRDEINRRRIKVHESFLPEENPARDTVVFELGIPNWLSAYRDATWQIIRELAHPYKPGSAQKSQVRLEDCKPLQGFTRANSNRISLASSIKGFGQTHYKLSKLRVSPKLLFVPFGADFRLYDSRSRIWIEDLTNPLTLEHLCGIQVPDSLLPLLPKKLHPPTIVDGPSSYQIQGNQAMTPNDMSVQAFSAYQKLLSGKWRRWPNILVEMSSSNLNLSDENTMRVICQLAMQAGPGLPNDPLRVVHQVFKYPLFTARLTNILEQMLDSIQSNWREYNVMQLVITLALRLFFLSEGSLGIDILAAARKYLLKWISELRKKLHDTTDSTSAQRYSTYGIYAALLCRETFSTLIGSENRLSQDDLSAWMRASIAVQENTLHDLSRLSDTVRGLLLRDAKMVYHLQNHVKSAMIAYPPIVRAEILRGWSSRNPDVERAQSLWDFLPIPHNCWIVASTSGPFPETVHFNYIEGHLLVNGKPRAKLPLEIADDKAVKLIFGAQHLLTFPSRQPGMSHRLARVVEGHEVNFGLRAGCAVIRATRYNLKSGARETSEFIPGWIFNKLDSFDLPAELVQNCGHWLNINTRRLEVRRGLPNTPAFWNTRPKDWIIDVPSRMAFRGAGGSQLVDPQSETFGQIAKIFRNFSQPDKLTVFQPKNAAAKLTVELKHLDLHFEVNSNHLLQCQQLDAEIDPDQDAGTWYGLSSKIVMRDIKKRETTEQETNNTQNRSIIVPLGEPKICRHGPHVDVHIQGNSDYAKFKIDSILGRLSCSPEPRIVYAKALYHAITSFCLPDNLTGRTGSSEAFAILQSGAAQPWTPVVKMGGQIFEIFHKLVPWREYYPPDIKRLQKVRWDPNLTSSIQCDGYKPLIEAIKQKSNNLEVFATGSGFDISETDHLCHRGRAQRNIYDPLLDVESNEGIVEAFYTPRDRRSGAEAAQVYQISRVILSRCLQFYMGTTLKDILESSEILGGFSAPDNKQPTSHVSSLISKIEDPINENWGELVNFCRHSSNRATLLFRLGLLAFNCKANMDMIHSLAALGLINEIKNLDPPQHQYFANFQSREPPSVDLLESLIKPSYPEFQPVEECDDEELLFDAAHRVTIENAYKEEGLQIASRIHQHWPMPTDDLTANILEQALDKPHQDLPRSLIDMVLAWDRIKPEWQRRLANIELSNYITHVDKVLLLLRGAQDDTTPVPWGATEPDFMVAQRSFTYHSIVQDWAAKCGPALRAGDSKLPSIIGEDAQVTTYSYQTPSTPSELAELNKILQDFEQSENSLRRRYARDLRQSFTALENMTKKPELPSMTFIPESEAIKAALGCAETRVRSLQMAITTAFGLHDDRTPWLEIGAIRPISTPTELLKLLRSTASLQFGPGMKQSIVSYGLAITNVQHLVRIHRAISRNNPQALQDELCHLGHENWEPINVPDWLLLEIDSDILIRAEQVVVARAIIDPKLGNGVLQLSMGKGKTSCIIPMVEAVLADGQNLSRVIVPKALIMQTAQTMQSRLGGLVGREVIHIPYTRRTSTKQDALDLYADLHRRTQQYHGVMLTCAEHLLSYKLFGWQKFVDSKNYAADQMIKFQSWLDTHCRDVLDECDFTLSVKTQLNYPSGPEMPVDFHPYRWKIAQEILGIAASHIQELQRKHPRGIQVTSRRGKKGFPAVQFLKTEAENALHDIIMESVCSGHLTLLRPIPPQSRQKRSVILEVLRATKISQKLLERAAHMFDNPGIAKDALLLVRGLLLYRIIVLCLGKRWNVQYGLHPNRDPIAVPYEAKGKPSEQAEYGYPDVAILFTCLSFYYAGLTRDQLVQGVQNILQSNDPAAQYEWWTSTCTELPTSLRHWNVINADDKGQMDQLWGLLRLNRIVVNHYLNHFVFPAHARQFEIKLQACSWDIPIFSEGGNQQTRTTGFSGTNDNRLMLPLTISQRDLPELQHTSAEVLSYLLQKRNHRFHVIANEQGQRLTEKEFLRDLKAKGVSILIDVGAYISEMGNQQLAHAWLEVDFEAKAVVYFGSDNRAWVHYRANTKEDVPLLATPLAENLSGCNVYLDEGHTRGVDLRLPTNAHGAVTLALKLTKDHTVQAAMRLRQLRTTQSICFYGPPEVDQSIREFSHLNDLEKINSSHVVSWLLEQTCRSVEDLEGLYVAQGIDFCRRTDTIWHCKDFKTKYSQRQRLLRVLKQPERKTLQELYGPASETSSTSSGGNLTSRQLRSFMSKLVRTSNSQQGNIKSGALEEVEQEREVETQVEEVRQVEKRKRYAALKYPGMHPDIMQFAQTGVLKALYTETTANAGFEHAFAFVGRTAVAKRFGVGQTSSKLFVSGEFVNTVQVARNSKESDNFLRPVEWIVWSPETETALIVIPEEVESLMEFLHDQEDKPRVHIIAYAAPVTKAMIHFNHLEFYSFPELPRGHTIPESIRIELGILSGRLYVDPSEWEGLTKYVRVSKAGASNSLDKIAADPAAFILEWLAIRRKTVDVLHTPMGFICTGRDMEKTDSLEAVDEAQQSEDEKEYLSSS